MKICPVETELFHVDGGTDRQTWWSQAPKNSPFCPHSALNVFCMDVKTNSDYFPLQHWMTGVYNRLSVFTARYGLGLCVQTAWVFVFKG